MVDAGLIDPGQWKRGGTACKPIEGTGMMDIDWRIEREFWGANQAEHAIVGDYELVAFDIPADARGDGAAIGWEIFTGAPKFLDLVAKGDAADFMAAKRAAETYFATIGGSETHH